jgi:hypothetical protein
MCRYSEAATCVRAGRSSLQPGDDGRAQFVVMLRNPVERTLSEYFWGRANWCLSYEHSQVGTHSGGKKSCESRRVPGGRSLTRPLCDSHRLPSPGL